MGLQLTPVVTSGNESEDVTAAGSIGDHELVRGDGGGKGVQGSALTLSDLARIESATNDFVLAATGLNNIQLASGTNVNIGTNAIDPAGPYNGMGHTSTINNTGNNNFAISGFRQTLVHKDDDNLTAAAGSAVPVRAIYQKDGIGTDTSVYVFSSFAEQTVGGTITGLSGYEASYTNDAGAITKYFGLQLLGKTSGTVAVNSYAFDLAAEFISNSRAVIATNDSGTTSLYIPLSTADTGITYDSTDLVLATTTSGNVSLTPAGILNIDVSITEAGANWSGVDIDTTVSPTGANAREHRGVSVLNVLATNENLTLPSGGLIGSDSTIINNGTGTITVGIGSRSAVWNNTSGVFTVAVGVYSNVFKIANGSIGTGTGFYSVATNTSVTGSIGTYIGLKSDIDVNTGTITNRIGIELASSESATNNWVLDYSSDFISNSRALKVTPDSGTNTDYIPVSQADTGITYDSTDLVLSTTTSGDMNLVPAGVIELGGKMNLNGNLVYGVEYDNGDSGATETIDFAANGNYQMSTLTDNVTFTLTAPTGPAHLTLRMIQDAGGTNTVAWPGTVKWAGGTEPTWDTTGDRENYAFFYWNGTNYIGSGVENITP